MPITHLLLDIEGTTCPVQFVAEVLFPYARERLETFLQVHGTEAAIQELVQAVLEAWVADGRPDTQKLLAAQRATPSGAQPVSVVPYLNWLMDHDIKLTALKDLQGRIWTEGYSNGEIVAPLFDDVPTALRLWHQQGLVLAVYSSGSVPAQQLLYGHSHAGNLCHLFKHWFDTRMGAKQDTASYRKISEAMGVSSQEVLFISDSEAELEAAAALGMAVLLSDRNNTLSQGSADDTNTGTPTGPDPNNGRSSSRRFERINSFEHVVPQDVAPQP